MNARHHTLGPALALAALTAIWGYNWIVIKIALVDSPPLKFAALRSVLSGLLLFALMLLLRRSLRPARGGSLILLGVLQTMGFVGFSAMALKTGAAGKSAVLAYTMPFWTLIFAGPLIAEYVQRLQLPAVALAAFGLIFIISPWSETLDLAASLYAIGAAISWSLATIVAKRMALEGNDLLNVSAWQMIYGGVGIVVLALLLETEPVNWTLQFSVAMAYNVILATALAWFLFLYALKWLSAGMTGLASLGTPVMVIATAWLQLGEVPTPAEGVGMAFIFTALAWLSVLGWRRISPKAGGA